MKKDVLDKQIQVCLSGYPPGQKTVSKEMSEVLEMLQDYLEKTKLDETNLAQLSKYVSEVSELAFKSEYETIRFRKLLAYIKGIVGGLSDFTSELFL